jgi:hypothetical protein
MPCRRDHTMLKRSPVHGSAQWRCVAPLNLADFNLSEALCRILVSLDCAEGNSCEAALRHQAICLSVRTLMNSQPKTMTAQSSNYRCQNGYNYASLLKVPLKKYPGLLLSSFVILLLIAHDNEFTRNRASELLGIWLVTAWNRQPRFSLVFGLLCSQPASHRCRQPMLELTRRISIDEKFNQAEACIINLLLESLIDFIGSHLFMRGHPISKKRINMRQTHYVTNTQCYESFLIDIIHSSKKSSQIGEHRMEIG